MSRQLRLARRPVGAPDDRTFEVTESAVPEPGDGQLVVRVTHVSIDPAMRAWLDATVTYMDPVGIGEVMRAQAIGEVVASRHERFATGTVVIGRFGVCEHAVVDGRGIRAVDTAVAPPEVWLGTLGVTGLTAYIGLLDVGRAAAGDTVVVSGAAGAVGSIVGQVARLRGCRAIGIAGGEAKCRWLVEELGFDGAVDYKGAAAVGEGLARLAPDGIDVAFDNVGVPVLDAMLDHLALGARVVICGAVSQYNAEQRRGPASYLQLVERRASMTGFVVLDHPDRYAAALDELGGWLRSGELRSREDVVHGTVADYPAVLMRLFDGANTGKLVLALES